MYLFEGNLCRITVLQGSSEAVISCTHTTPLHRTYISNLQRTVLMLNVDHNSVTVQLAFSSRR